MMSNELMELSKFFREEDNEKGQYDMNPKTCRPKDYVQSFLLPFVLPALDKMLTTAINENVLERRRAKFNACDFLTEYLYNKNEKRLHEDDVILWDIPFVKEILQRKPRPPLPLSLILSEEEAAVIIQSSWRGYVVRKHPHVQELRQYQKEMRESSYHIMFPVEDFRKQHNIEKTEEGAQEETELRL